MAEGRTRLTALERLKVQAQVLVPLVKHLERELGKAEAHRLVRGGLSEHIRSEAGRRGWADNPRQGMTGEGLEQAYGDALVVEVTAETDEEFTFDVRHCEFAEFYRKLGEPELGFLLVCSTDYDVAEHVPGLELERSQTIMEGADHCDFRWRFLDRLGDQQKG